MARPPWISAWLWLSMPAISAAASRRVPASWALSSPSPVESCGMACGPPRRWRETMMGACAIRQAPLMPMAENLPPIAMVAQLVAVDSRAVAAPYWPARRLFAAVMPAAMLPEVPRVFAVR